MKNGIPYAVQPLYWPYFQNNFGFVLLYNIDLVISQGHPNLHEYYENETWTWDVYQPMIENFDKGIDDNIYALSAMTRDFADCALRSNGVRYADYIDGTYKTDILSNKAINAVQWMKDLYLNNTENIDIASSWEIDNFIDGRVMTSLTVLPHVVSGKLQYESDIDFSIMPFPCGPDGVYGEWAQTAAAIRGLAIPANCETPELSARVINDLCDPFEKLGGNEGLSEFFNENVFFDPIDTEIYFAVGEHIRYNYGRGSRSVGMYTLTNKIASAYKTSSAIEILESMYSVMNEFVETEVKPNFENYIHEHLWKD